MSDEILQCWLRPILDLEVILLEAFNSSDFALILNSTACKKVPRWSNAIIYLDGSGSD